MIKNDIVMETMEIYIIEAPDNCTRFEQVVKARAGATSSFRTMPGLPLEQFVPIAIQFKG